MVPRFLIKQVGSGSILLRRAGLWAGDDECKVGHVQFQLPEGLVEGRQVPERVDKVRSLKRGLCWRMDLGVQL